MKIYIAASFNSQAIICGYRDQLQDEFGHTVTSRWLNNPMPVERFGTPEASLKAVEDFADIALSDLFVLCTRQPSTTGGMHTELGFAFGIGRPIIIIGPRENIFQSIKGIIQFSTWNGFIHYIRKVSEDATSQAR